MALEGSGEEDPDAVVRGKVSADVHARALLVLSPR